MASFTNFATLSYNGGTTNSNIVTGEILEALTAVKTAVSANYSAGDRITYALSLVNTGTAAITDYTVTDNLGGYTVGANTVYPLAYNAGTVRSYINGVLQTAPTVTAGPPLTVTGLMSPLAAAPSSSMRRLRRPSHRSQRAARSRTPRPSPAAVSQPRSPRRRR